MTQVRVIRAGLSTTIQDLGRPGFRSIGVPLGGAMDRMAHELANRLVGNSAAVATLEMTMSGDELQWSHAAVIAVTGANMAPVAISGSGSETAIPLNSPVTIVAEARLRFHTAKQGCRSYLAVAGGFDVPQIMGSRATYLRAALGGFGGRVLRNGDEIPIAESTNRPPKVEHEGVICPPWFVRPISLPRPDEMTVRVLQGCHFHRMSRISQRDFFSLPFTISPQSDRMGYRLTGPRLSSDGAEEMLSEGTTVGTIQLPANGQPIILMADSAPTGGYPRIAHVISADHPVAAQLRPGQSVRFEEVALTEAQQLFLDQRRDFERALLMADLVSRASSRLF